MDADTRKTRDLPQKMQDIASELEDWFSVAGDMDDFIYYDAESGNHSER